MDDFDTRARHDDLRRENRELLDENTALKQEIGSLNKMLNDVIDKSGQLSVRFDERGEMLQRLYDERRELSDKLRDAQLAAQQELSYRYALQDTIGDLFERLLDKRW